MTTFPVKTSVLRSSLAVSGGLSDAGVGCCSNQAHPDKANKPVDNKIAIDFTASVYLVLYRESTDYE